MSGEIERHDPDVIRGIERVTGETYDYERDLWRRQAAAAGAGGELDPEWVMVGVDVPAGKRLYASKDLKGSAFQVASQILGSGSGDGWYLTTTMCHMLVITRPTYGECMAELMRIWANWENEGRELPSGARRAGGHAGPSGEPHDMTTTEPTAEQITLATIREHVERMLALTADSGVRPERQSHAAGYDSACRDVLAILDMNGRPAHEPVVFSSGD